MVFCSSGRHSHNRIELASISRKLLHYFGEPLHIRYNLDMFRLMCITAHPDDEAGGFGGTLRMYSDRGVETCVVCLTPGQAASHRGGAKSDSELAEIRRNEFAASCKLLNVSRPIVLDYPDGQLYLQQLNRVVYDLTQHMRQFRPQVVMTFAGEGGVTGHPDHSMAGVFATLAFQWAGRTNRYADQLNSGLQAHRAQKLYYGTADFTLPGRQPVTFAPATAVIEIGGFLETKIQAFKAHASQQPLWSLFEENARKSGAKEMFHLAAATKPPRTQRENDLFDGVEDD
jgi:LmbE family N-acetylglucosaminyl deacetylase